MTVFKVRFSSDTSLKARFCGGKKFAPKMSDYIEVPVGETYDGNYVITPSDEEQILPTQGLVSSNNFTIKPVPNTYGRIAWNGSAITVY